jgi:hypothetical protein
MASARRSADWLRSRRRRRGIRHMALDEAQPGRPRRRPTRLSQPHRGEAGPGHDMAATGTGRVRPRGRCCRGGVAIRRPDRSCRRPRRPQPMRFRIGIHLGDVIHRDDGTVRRQRQRRGGSRRSRARAPVSDACCGARSHQLVSSTEPSSNWERRPPGPHPCGRSRSAELSPAEPTGRWRRRRTARSSRS